MSSAGTSSCFDGSRWLWGPRADLSVFGGSALAAIGLVLLAPVLSDGGGVPLWGFVLLIVAIDVAHVYSSLFRTYLDGDELRRRPLLYGGVPVLCFVAGLVLHVVSAELFWRVLAYLAVWHFVRQQVGWVAIYRAKAGERGWLDRALDDATIYAATLMPVVYWHVHLPRAFRWFTDDDFVPLPWLEPLLPALWWLYAAILVAYLARAVLRVRAGQPLNLGKHVVVATTVVTWFVGIVATNTDFEFTAANVIVHGVPYMALLFAYARERGRERPGWLLSRIVRGGIWVFVAFLFVVAYFEELLWDRLVWHARPLVFGGVEREEPLLGTALLAVVVALLAVPQATHYVLDAVLWRRGDTGPAQARALGFRRSPSTARAEGLA